MPYGQVSQGLVSLLPERVEERQLGPVGTAYVICSRHVAVELTSGENRRQRHLRQLVARLCFGEEDESLKSFGGLGGERQGEEITLKSVENDVIDVR